MAALTRIGRQSGCTRQIYVYSLQLHSGNSLLS